MLIFFSLVKANTYLYQFDYTLQANKMGAKRPAWLKADHSEEMLLALGMPFMPANPTATYTTGGKPYTDSDKAMSRIMMSYWANFAKTG